MKKPMLKKTAALVLSAGMLMLSFSPFASSATFSGFGLCVYAQEGDEIIANNASGMPDKVLYDIVLQAGDDNKDGVLTKQEAESITEIRAEHAGIKDLTGIQYLKKMAFLDATDNQISDISMLNKQDTPELAEVYLGSNQISDASPLKDLTDMTDLDLSDNQISDISSLKDLTHLVTLDLTDNQISDISALENMTNLSWGLRLGNNRITDITPLRNMTKLFYELDLSNNRISDISPLQNLTELWYLYLSGNQVSDVTPLRDMAQLSELHIDHNNISDISPLKDSKLLEGIAQSDAFWPAAHTKKYAMAEGNRITLEQALEILPKSLLEAKEKDSEGNETGRTWLDTEKFITSATGNVVVSEDGSIHYYVNGVEDTTYTGMAQDSTTGAKYWFDNGVAAADKQVYSPEDDAWYWFDANGTMAVGKDVFIPKSNDDRSQGKWVRYDENGRMVKGEDYANGGWYRFDKITGEMAKGFYSVEDGDVTKLYYYNEATGIMEHGAVNIDGTEYAFDDVTGVAVNKSWYSTDGNEYWYENGVRQGTEGRGKEIYDPVSDGWYWLDAVDGGKKAVSKDVYQESYAGVYADREDGTGKWVRYDENGLMIKGWSEQNGNRYYFDTATGAMAKGTVEIDGVQYTFSWETGVLQQ